MITSSTLPEHGSNLQCMPTDGIGALLHKFIPAVYNFSNTGNLLEFEIPCGNTGKLLEFNCSSWKFLCNRSMIDGFF